MTLSGEWRRNCDSGGLTARLWLTWVQGMPQAGGQLLWLPTAQVGWWDIINPTHQNHPVVDCYGVLKSNPFPHLSQMMDLIFFSKAHSDLLRFLAADTIPLKCCWHAHFNITLIASYTFWWGSSHRKVFPCVDRRRFLLALFNSSVWLTMVRFSMIFSALYKRLLVCCLL